MRGTLEGQTLRFERRLAHDVEKVWRVLTDEAETAYWFPGRITGARAAGAPIRFVFDPKPPGVVDAALAALIASKQDTAFGEAPPELFEGTIVVFDPPRVFELTWAGDRLRFELSPDGAGTRLVFTHTFADAAAADVAAGWHVSLDWLANRLAGAAPPTTLVAFRAIEAEYREALGLRA